MCVCVLVKHNRQLLGVSVFFVCFFFVVNETSQRNSQLKGRDSRAKNRLCVSVFRVLTCQVDPVCRFLECVCLKQV